MDTSVFLNHAVLRYLLSLEKNIHTKVYCAQRSIHTEAAFHLAAERCKYRFQMINKK